MIKKTPIELEKYLITKAVRAKVRLKYSLAADIELNNSLPDVLEEFDKGIQSGELKQLLEEAADANN